MGVAAWLLYAFDLSRSARGSCPSRRTSCSSATLASSLADRPLRRTLADPRVEPAVSCRCRRSTGRIRAAAVGALAAQASPMNHVSRDARGHHDGAMPPGGSRRDDREPVYPPTARAGRARSGARTAARLPSSAGGRSGRRSRAARRRPIGTVTVKVEPTPTPVDVDRAAEQRHEPLHDGARGRRRRSGASTSVDLPEHLEDHRQSTRARCRCPCPHRETRKSPSARASTATSPSRELERVADEVLHDGLELPAVGRHELAEPFVHAKRTAAARAARPRARSRRGCADVTGPSSRSGRLEAAHVERRADEVHQLDRRALDAPSVSFQLSEPAG